jgi:hypothetical protein
MTWQLAIELRTGLQVGMFCCDNGELKTGDVKTWLTSRGITQQFTAPHTSAHIGCVERLHCTLMNKARTMRIETDLPPNHWDEFILTANYLTIRTPTTSTV